MSRNVSRAAFVFAASLAILLGACGNPRETRLPETGATLEGTVKYGTESLHFAQVMVLGDGKMATGRIDDDGRYKVENCPLGAVKIAVNTAAARGEYQSAVMQGGAYKGPNKKGRSAVNIKFVDVPQKYADPEKSGLATNISEGTNTYDIVVPK